MVTEPTLGLTLVPDGTAALATFNTDLAALAAGANGGTPITLGGTDLTLTETQFLSGLVFVCSGATAAINLYMPASPLSSATTGAPINRVFAVYNAGSYAINVRANGATSGGTSVPTGGIAIFFGSGPSVIPIATGGAGGVIIESGGTAVGTAATLNFSTNLAVTLVGTVATIVASGGGGGNGIGGTYGPYVDVKSSRVLNTVYTNNNSQPIEIAVNLNSSNNSSNYYIAVNGVNVTNISSFVTASNLPLTAIANPGDTYEVLTSDSSYTIATWFEKQLGTAGNLIPFGSYADKTSSRAYGTVYTNTLAQPILIQANVANSAAGHTTFLNVNGVNVSSAASPGSGFGIEFIAIANPGDTYELTNDGGSWSISTWFEKTLGVAINSGNVVTANHTAIAGETVYADTSGGSFTVTVPLTGTVEIKDVALSFGTYPLTIIAPSSAAILDGISYTNATSVVLNAPGNDATCYGNGTNIKVKQVTNGLWSMAVASSASSLTFTGFAPHYQYDLHVDNVATSASGQILFQVGYGSPITYETGSNYSNAGFNGDNSVTNALSTTVGVLGSINYQSWSGNGLIDASFYNSGQEVNVQSMSNYNGARTFAQINMTSSPFTGFKIIPVPGQTFSGTFTLSWKKLNA